MIIGGIIIIVFVLIGFWFVKAEHHTKKIKIVVLVLIGLLLYFSMMSIFTSEEISLASPRGIVNAVYVYFGWIGQTTSTLWDIGTDTVHLVGNAIKVNDTETNQPRR